jgi:hypothetical protein
VDPLDQSNPSPKDRAVADARSFVLGKDWRRLGVKQTSSWSWIALKAHLTTQAA